MPAAVPGRSRTSPWIRGIGALVAAALAVLLARPEPPVTPPTWESILAPYAVGAPVVRGYRLMPLRRGEEHDVVMIARRDDGPDSSSGQVEVHVVDRGRWSGVRETPSFGVAYETPRSSAAPEDSAAVSAALADAVQAHDPGLLSVDAIPLEAEPEPPALARALERLGGGRGAAFVCLVSLALGLIATLRFGGVWVALALGTGGLALRLTRLGLPFVHDQDVQRVMTSHGSWRDILTGMGLRDRHPPLYFAILHVVQAFGQAEAVVRAPAALAGALLGPAIVLASWVVRRRIDAIAVISALVATLSPELVARSREVSEIPLFTLLAITALGALAADTFAFPRTRAAVLAISHGLLFWTYYLAPFVVLGGWAVRWPRASLDRSTLRAGMAGLLLGAPAIVLALVTFARDRGARQVAARLPDLAWGDRSPWAMARDLWRLSDETFGWPLLVAWIALSVVSFSQHRRRAALIPIAAVLATALGLMAFAPFARLQPYYFVAVLPLLPLSAALAAPLRSSQAERAATLLLAACAALFLQARLPSARLTYLPSADAFMPSFAEAVAARPERAVLVVAHYDATLLNYYLARRAGTTADWGAINDAGEFQSALGKTIVPLAKVHQLADGTGAEAAAVITRHLGQGRVLVLDREQVRMPDVEAVLRRCEVIRVAPCARLLACGG